MPTLKSASTPLNPWLVQLNKQVELLQQKWSKVGTIRLITWKEYFDNEFDPKHETPDQFLESRNMDFTPDDSDWVLDYDFMDDELSDQEREEFTTDYYKLWDITPYLRTWCTYDFDGSGGGLYYGLNLYETR